MSYGLAVAKTVRFPHDIMNEAFELSGQFTAGLSVQSVVRNKCIVVHFSHVFLCWHAYFNANALSNNSNTNLESPEAETIECGSSDFATESENSSH